MLMGLKQGQAKMSKSDPDSAIFMEDTVEDVNRKIKKGMTCNSLRCAFLMGVHSVLSAGACADRSDDGERRGDRRMGDSG